MCGRRLLCPKGFYNDSWKPNCCFKQSLCINTAWKDRRASIENTNKESVLPPERILVTVAASLLLRTEFNLLTVASPVHAMKYHRCPREPYKSTCI